MSEENKDQSNEKDASEINCIKCGAKNPPNNLFCTTCGYNFVEKVNCPKCNGEVPAFNTFCNHCGTSMKTAQTISSQRPARIVTEVPQQQTPTSQYRQQPQFGQQQYGHMNQFRPMTQEEAAKYQEQLKAQQVYARNRMAKFFGIFLVIVGLGNFGAFLFSIFTTNSDTVNTFLASFGISFPELTPGLLYGSLIATYILQGIILLITGSSLIFYKPDDNAWKGFFKVLRYVFIGLVGFITLLIISTLIFWTFYHPRYNVAGKLPFWFFTSFGISVNMPAMLLWAIFLLTYLTCIGMLIGPSIYNFTKDRKKKKEGTPEVIIEDSTPTTNQYNESFSPLIAFSEVEKRKVRMPDIFYRIKNSSFMKTFELFGMMFLVSIGVAFLLSGLIPEEDLVPIDTNPVSLFLSATWAGISEEISFRLILIGIPMIVVVAIRYLIETGKISMPSYQMYLKGTDFFKIKSRVARIDSSLELTKWDIALAIRGKYKRVGYPEWALIGISSLLFGFAHWDDWTGDWGAWKIVHAGVIGLFLGYAFVKYGIEAAIVLHLTNNAITAITNITTSGGFEWILGLTTFLVTTFSLIGFMKILSEALNFVHKNRMRKEAMLRRRM